MIAQASRTPLADAITMASSCIIRPTHRPNKDVIVKEVAMIMSAFIVLVLI